MSYIRGGGVEEGEGGDLIDSYDLRVIDPPAEYLAMSVSCLFRHP